MNNKKAKQIRGYIEKTYGDKYHPSVVNSIYKKVKKNYSRLSAKNKKLLLDDVEMLISIVEDV